MPTNKNAMTRYMILDELLSNRYHNYSLDDLTEEVSNRLVELYPKSDGVVRRTIEKDLKYLEVEGPFLADIERYTVPAFNKETQKTYNKQCLRYANPSYSIFKKKMSSEESYLLHEALTILGQFEGLPNLDALERLRLGLKLNRKQKKIISFTKNPLENSNLLGELFVAISQRQVIELHYHTFNAPEDIRETNLHPYLLKEYNRRWFLIAAAESDGKILNFPLDRIDKVVPLPSHKYIEYNGDINELFEDIVGVTLYDDKPVEYIVFWVDDRSEGYVSTKPIHESQKPIRGDKEEALRVQYPQLIGGKFFSIECKYNYELIRELCSFGKELIVLSSDCIVANKVRERVIEMADQYRRIENNK